MDDGAHTVRLDNAPDEERYPGDWDNCGFNREQMTAAAYP